MIWVREAYVFNFFSVCTMQNNSHGLCTPAKTGTITCPLVVGTQYPLLFYSCSELLLNRYNPRPPCITQPIQVQVIYVDFLLEQALRSTWCVRTCPMNKSLLSLLSAMNALLGRRTGQAGLHFMQQQALVRLSGSIFSSIMAPISTLYVFFVPFSKLYVET